MIQAPYVGSTVAAKIVVTDGKTNLFRYAARELGNALLAWQLAAFNGLSDFWPDAGISLVIPQIAADDNDGIEPA